jgi:DNA mismatch repair ATPase MutL
MKTPKIHILSDEIINKIAAGEVIGKTSVCG